VNGIGRGTGCERAAGVEEGGCSVARARARAASCGERRAKDGLAPRRREEHEDEGAACVATGRTGDGHDPEGSHVGWKILREEHAVSVSAAEGRRGGGTAARRWEEAGACAVQVRQVRKDAVDNARVGYEGNDPQSGRAGVGAELSISRSSAVGAGAVVECGWLRAPGTQAGRV